MGITPSGRVLLEMTSDGPWGRRMVVARVCRSSSIKGSACGREDTSCGVYSRLSPVELQISSKEGRGTEDSKVAIAALMDGFNGLVARITSAHVDLLRSRSCGYP